MKLITTIFALESALALVMGLTVKTASPVATEIVGPIFYGISIMFAAAAGAAWLATPREGETRT